MAMSAEHPEGSNASDGAGKEFVAWAKQHEHEKRVHEAQLAQITEHPDIGLEQDAKEEQQAWAHRRDHEQHLHDSAIDQITNHNSSGLS